MGNESSFRSFPAHVHNLLTVLLAETHVVHTKVYPRYRSRRNISFARDDFSKWLEPHESSTTDVVLLGHSMGGLLSAEVVLLGQQGPAMTPLKHRILGTINFDVPFLGMHPGVVKSGLASIFKSADEPGDQWSDVGSLYSNDAASISTTSSLGPPNRNDTLWNPNNPDKNFNPSFNNDVILPMRTGWRNALHFVNKHSKSVGELTKATKQLVSSHMEFGGAMANYAELKTRYGRIRGLEEEDENVRKSVMKNKDGAPSRVRFVNYYTASTGHVKKKSKSPRQKLSPSPSANQSRASLSPSLAAADAEARGRQESGVLEPESARSRSPRISLEEHSDEGVVQKAPEIPSSEDEDWEEAAETLRIGDPATSVPSRSSFEDFNPNSLSSELPPAPPPLDVSYIQDPETRKLVEGEHARAVEAYEKAVADRQKAAAKQSSDGPTAEQTNGEGKQMTQKQQEELRLEKEKQRMEAEGRRLRGEPSPERAPQPAILEQTPSNISQQSTFSSSSSSRSRHRSRSRSPPAQYDTSTTEQKGDHKFCTLPPKDSKGERDRTWVRVFMANVDEVGAHCGLFFVDERYERLVGDVAGRIEEWVRVDFDTRMAEEADGPD